MLPKIKQRDGKDCGAACLAAVCAFYKLDISVAAIRQLAETGHKGTSIQGLLNAAQKMRFEAKGVRGNQESLSEIPFPAIAHIQTAKKSPHFIVLYKVRKKKVQFMDPADGKIHCKSIADFNSEWSGALLLLIPGVKFSTNSRIRSSYSRFFELIQPNKAMVIQILFGAFIYTILGLSTSIFIQKITDHVFLGGNRNLLNLMGCIMIAIVILQGFIGLSKAIFTIRVGQRVDAGLILSYYRHLLKLPQQFFDTMKIGEIMSRVNDAIKIRVFINEVLVNSIVNIFIILFSFALMFTYYWKLAALALTVIPFYLIIYFLSRYLNQKLSRNLMEHSADLESHFVESLHAINTVKRFGLENFSNYKIEGKFVRLFRLIYKSGLNNLYSVYASDFFSKLLTIILLWAGAGFVLDMEISPGELFSFYTLIGYLITPVAALITSNKTVEDAMVAADRLFEIMDLQIEEDDKKVVLKPQMIGDIRFDRVGFRYGGQVNVLENLNFRIEAGSFTAIVGESGSGKSTIANILQNIYTINSGDIFIGEYSIRYLNKASLRKQVSVVPQKIDLFSGNLIENIAIGEASPNILKVVEICSQLGILEFIESLPDGFQTELGENGKSLSGGQKQIIAIARALYRDSKVLIFDEATSSLDSHTEKCVSRAIKILQKRQKTIIMISHRLTTICEADKIIVLKKGKVVEEGNHYNMIKKNRYYEQLWSGQSV